jgi:hypothetical protein
MHSGRLFRYGEMGGDQRDVALLEQEFAAFVGRRYCVAVNSGGSALFVALKALGAAPGEPHPRSTASPLPPSRAPSSMPVAGPSSSRSGPIT